MAPRLRGTATAGMTRRTFHVSGDVQGVGFRWFVVKQARPLGLRGWTRNLSDGRVEVVAAGDDGALAQLERALQQGPPMARVDRVDAADAPPEVERMEGFTVR